MSIKFVLPICIMTLLGSLGAYFFKRAAEGLEHISIVTLIKSPMLYIGGVIYALAALMNVILLRFIDYSVLYPMTAFTYIWTLVISYFVLNEVITKQKIAAIFFVCTGVLLICI